MVTTAAGVAEALESLRLTKYDLLISDIEMPNEDGYSLIRKVRAQKNAEIGRTPAVALMAHARAADRMRAFPKVFNCTYQSPSNRRN
jgi:CheY-like chemotaxis protein